MEREGGIKEKGNYWISSVTYQVANFVSHLLGISLKWVLG